MDHNAPDRLRPSITESANGTPVVNIAPANSKGISVNRFEQFDVAHKGLIFNNAQADGISLIGGAVMRNSLAGAAAASAILAEVTGAQPSNLSGTMEVFGRKADVLIANQNGIVANGVSLLNFKSLTLSSGKSVVGPDETLLLNVSRGNVNIAGAGIDTTGLSFFDVVARSVTLNGPIIDTGAGAAITVVAGAVSYQPESRSYQRLPDDGTSPALYAIDGAAAGSMYGSQVRLIATETGAGVRHAAAVFSSGDVSISAEGDVRVVAVVAGAGGVSITAGSVSGIDAIESRQITIRSAGAMSLRGGRLSAGSINIEAASLSQQTGSVIEANGIGGGLSADPALRMTIAGDYILQGNLVAYDRDGAVIPEAVFRVVDGRLMAVNRSGIVIPGSHVGSDTIVRSGSGARIAAAGLLNLGAVIDDTNGAMSIAIDGKLENHGKIVTELGNLNVSVDDLSNGVLGSIESGADLAVLVAHQADNAGGIWSGTGHMTNLILPSASLMNSGGIAGGAVLISGAGPQSDSILENFGNLVANDGLFLDLGELRNSGAIRAGGALNIGVSGHLYNDGIIAGRAVEIAAGAPDNGWKAGDAASLVNRGGVIQSTGEDVKIDVQNGIDNHNSGAIQSNGKLLISSKAGVENRNAIMYAQSDLEVEAGGDIINDGAWMTANEGGLSLLGVGFYNRGHSGLFAAQDMRVRMSGNITNMQDSYLSAVQGMRLTAGGGLSNQDDSTIFADTLAIEASGEVCNTAQGVIYGFAGLMIDANFVLNDGKGSAIYSSGMLALRSRGGQWNREGALIEGGEVVLQAGGALTNSGAAAIQAEAGSAAIAAASVLNDAGVISATDDLLLTSDTDVHNANGALIYARRDLRLESGGDMVNDGAAQIRATNIDIEAAGNVLNDKSLLEADSVLSVVAKKYITRR